MGEAGTPSSDSYDAIVVGAGIGGLATGALLARTGRRVLIAERSDGPGGYGKPFRRGPYLFDPALHSFPEVEYVRNFLDYLGVADRVEFVGHDAPFRATYPGFSLTFPHGFDKLTDVLSAEFPAEAGAVRTFFRLRDTIFEEAASVPHRVGLGQLDAAAEAFPHLFKYRTATFGSVIDEHFSDDRLRAVMGSLWPYIGSPPERAGFIHYSQHLGAWIHDSHFAKGSFGTAVDALVAALETHGGELIVNSQVSKILVEGGRVGGVRLPSGDEVRAPLVISNADATATWEQLVGVDHLPSSYLKKLRRLKPSFSACALYTVTKLPLRELGATHETFVYRHWDHSQTYQDILDRKPGGMWISVPTVGDPSLAPEGQFVVILTSLAVYDQEWHGRVDRFREEMLDVLEGQFPGFRDNLEFAELATPLTFERYTGNREGAIYGWENTPRQTGSGRLTHETPIDGLLLTGQWTQEGGGFLRALVGGDFTVQHVLRNAGEEPLPSFRPAYMPSFTSFEGR